MINTLNNCMCLEAWIDASVVVCKLAQVEDSPVYKSTVPPNVKFKFVYIPTSRKGYLPKNGVKVGQFGFKENAIKPASKAVLSASP